MTVHVVRSAFDSFCVAANKCIESRGNPHNSLLHHKFAVRSGVPLDVREATENVLGLLVSFLRNYFLPPTNSNIYIFSCTFHVVHFLICCFYEGEFPSLSFWLLNVTCLVIMTVSSEYLCLQEEMKEIPLYQSLSTKADL